MGYKVVGVRHGKGIELAIFKDKQLACDYIEDIWYNTNYYEDLYVISEETGEIIAQFEV